MKRPLLQKRCALVLPVLASVVVIGSASAGEHCNAPLANWKPKDAVYAMARQQHWRIDKLKVDDGCYKVKGSDADGHPFKAKLDPVTLEVIRIKREGDHKDRHGDGVRGHHHHGASDDAVHADASAASRPLVGAPPGELLTPGSRPDVQNH